MNSIMTKVIGKIIGGNQRGFEVDLLPKTASKGDRIRLRIIDLNKKTEIRHEFRSWEAHWISLFLSAALYEKDDQRIHRIIVAARKRKRSKETRGERKR